MKPPSSVSVQETHAANCAQTGPMGVAVFDFISHENMHHAFNEEYLRILHAAFPADPILFHAVEGHVARLSPRLRDIGNIAFQPCRPFQVPFGLSRHNPVGGRLAARRCLKAMVDAISGRALRMVVLLGVDANLFSVVGRRWPTLSTAPLHMVLHGQLGDTMIWRSRNPFIRAADFVSVLAKPLPPAVHIVALELGVREAIAEIAPGAASSIHTLEHPVLVSEWGPDPVLTRGGATKIAFLGHARRAKGFPAFAEMARLSARSDMEFQAIGLASPDTAGIDLGPLSRGPSQESMPRADYLAALQTVDLVCLPLHGRAYDFTASGTVSDAVAALKPLVALRNKPLEAIVRKYGEIGYLVDSEADLMAWARNFDRADFERRRPAWVANLRAIREARRPERLARDYALTL